MYDNTNRPTATARPSTSPPSTAADRCVAEAATIARETDVPETADIVHAPDPRHPAGRPSTVRPVRWIALATFTGMLLAACGGSDGDGSVDLADGLPSAAVCNGEPSSVNPPSSDPFSGYVYLNDGEGWSTGWSGAFGEQHAIVGDDATSILCVSVADSTEVERCEYEEDGEAFTLVMASATYDLELRHADTAAVVATDTVTAEAGECPFVTSWTAGEGERISYPTPAGDALAATLEPFLG